MEAIQPPPSHTYQYCLRPYPTAGWEAALTTKEVEAANLAAALGELTYESEAAERLRKEARLAQARVQVRAWGWGWGWGWGWVQGWGGGCWDCLEL